MVDPITESSPSEHLKSVYMLTYNKIVNEVFKDIDVDDELLSPGVSKQSLKKACKVLASDSQILINNRSQLFHLVLRQARDYHPSIIGNKFTETEDFYNRSEKVKIHLYFEEDNSDVEENYFPVEGTIGFRVMDETTSSITNQKLITIANKIKTEFGLGDGYIWKKGKSVFSYTDHKKGYQLQLFVKNEADGKELTSKILDIQGHTPDWKLAHYKSNQAELESYPYNPGNQSVLGKVIKKPRRRPIASVRFKTAFASLPGVPRAVYLYDKTFTELKVLVSD
jgi:hypothetical protein